jgi:hypothetical protein
VDADALIAATLKEAAGDKDHEIIASQGVGVKRKADVGGAAETNMEVFEIKPHSF